MGYVKEWIIIIIKIIILVILVISNKISYWKKSSVMLFLKIINFMEFYI